MVSDVLRRFEDSLQDSAKASARTMVLVGAVGTAVFSFYTVPELTKIVQKSGLKVVKTVLIKSKQIKKKSQSDTVWMCMYARKGNERIV